MKDKKRETEPRSEPRRSTERVAEETRTADAAPKQPVSVDRPKAAPREDPITIDPSGPKLPAGKSPEEHARDVRGEPARAPEGPDRVPVEPAYGPARGDKALLREGTTETPAEAPRSVSPEPEMEEPRTRKIGDIPADGTVEASADANIRSGGDAGKELPRGGRS